MSTVVGVVNKDGVWIGSDDYASSDSGEKRPIIVRKVFRNGGYLFGCVGSVRASQILFPKHFEPPEDIAFLPDMIRNHFKERGCISLSLDDQTEAHTSNFLVGYQGKLYEILVDFQMNQVSGYDAIGAGTQFAFGSFYTTEKLKLRPEQRMKLALQAASKFDTTTGPPFIIEKL